MGTDLVLSTTVSTSMDTAADSDLWIQVVALAEGILENTLERSEKNVTRYVNINVK